MWRITLHTTFAGEQKPRYLFLSSNNAINPCCFTTKPIYSNHAAVGNADGPFGGAGLKSVFLGWPWPVPREGEGFDRKHPPAVGGKILSNCFPRGTFCPQQPTRKTQKAGCVPEPIGLGNELNRWPFTDNSLRRKGSRRRRHRRYALPFQQES
ncbi:unnamed protein product [Ectocarpus sp. 4 AP-2014]